METFGNQLDDYGNPIHHHAAGHVDHLTDGHADHHATTGRTGGYGDHHGITGHSGAAPGAVRRSGSSSSSSSSEDDGLGGRRRKKKGIKERIKEKLPGGHKDEQDHGKFLASFSDLMFIDVLEWIDFP